MELVENELAAAIKGCFYDVQNEVGLGLPEEAYQQGLIAAFAERGLPVLSKNEVWLAHRGRRVVKFLPDFQIAGKVVIETSKAFASPKNPCAFLTSVCVSKIVV